MQWYFTCPLQTAEESVELPTRTGWLAAEELADPRSEMLVHAAGRMEMVSPHRSVPLADVPLPKTIIGRRFKDEVEKVPRGQNHRRDIFVL